MKEIKFRSWSSLRGMQQVKGLEFIQRLISTPTDDGQFWVDKFSDMELMQFIGLTDRESREVYEGDIISGFSGEVIGTIKWSEEDCAFIFRTPSNGGAMLNGDYLFNFIVIGNIYENPELLEVNNG